MKTEEKAVELLFCPFCGCPPDFVCGLVLCSNRDCTTRMVSYRVEDWNTRAPASKWISVEERLPEHEDAVLGFVPSWREKNLRVRYHDCLKEWRIEGQCGAYAVTHWQPLPPPPELMTKGKL